MKYYIIAIAVAFSAGCDRPGGAPASAAPVTVFAASSLKETLEEAAAEWSKKSGKQARLQFEASSTLARQIKEGAPADVFISAAPEWIDEVRAAERFDWLSNRLVLVVPKESPDVDVKKLESLALANEQVPVGKYAKAALAHLGIAVPARTIYGSNVRDVLSKVSSGGCQAGIVYVTDAAVDPAVRVAYTFPPDSHPRILYTAGRLTPAGQAFYQALREPWAADMARKRGFEVLR